MKTWMQRLINFLATDVWRIQASQLSRGRSFLLKQLRVFILAVRGFRSDRCSLRASALTFYTILSIVPVVAMAFGIAKGFGLEGQLQTQLQKALEGQEQVVEWILSWSEELLKSTQGGLVAGVGVAVLLWTVIKVLGNIEKAFNHIWGVKKSRGLIRKFTDYISIMLVGPILVIVSSGITVIISENVEGVFKRVEFLGFLAPVIVVALSVLPFCIAWALFAFVYVFMPNTKVNLRSALIAGIAAGTIFQIVNWGYVNFQIGVANYNAIYGSFAALPLFLIWLQLSWLVVLFGAELSFAHQNVETYEFEPDCLAISPSFKRLVTLRTAQLLVKNFAEGEKPMTAAQLSHELGAPIRLVNEILYELVHAGILSETRLDENDREGGYQPARDIHTITVGSVVNALDRRGTDDLPIMESEELKKLSGCLESFAEAIKSSPANIPLKDV